MLWSMSRETDRGRCKEKTKGTTRAKEIQGSGVWVSRFYIFTSLCCDHLWSQDVSCKWMDWSSRWADSQTDKATSIQAEQKHKPTNPHRSLHMLKSTKNDILYANTCKSCQSCCWCNQILWLSTCCCVSLTFDDNTDKLSVVYMTEPSKMYAKYMHKCIQMKGHWL